MTGFRSKTGGLPLSALRSVLCANKGVFPAVVVRNGSVSSCSCARDTNAAISWPARVLKTLTRVCEGVREMAAVHL
jgi:hypothetical protein